MDMCTGSQTGMRGTIPKPSNLRQRRNKTSTRATFVSEEKRRRAPPLPEIEDREDWHVMTRHWWRDVWHSPMAGEFLQADIHGLYRLAELIDGFWNNPTTTLAAEIRQEQQAYGLSPIDRRRLQWEVQRAEGVTKRTAERPKHEMTGPDPRTALRAVK